MYKTKKISTDFVISKIEKCKEERNKLLIIRNCCIILISSAVFLADLGGHLPKDNFSILAILFSYFYGCLALGCLSLQIAYNTTKYTKYTEILKSKENQEFDEEGAEKLTKELIALSENKIYALMSINGILHTAPFVILLGLIYYFIETFNK